MSDGGYHMTPDEFRRRGRDLVDWIADYMEQVEQYPVLSGVEPGDIRASLPDHPPAHGENWDDILGDIDAKILPGITHWQSPNFFAYFNANTSGPSILGDLLSSGLGTQGMLWSTSPAATELETQVLDWLVEMLGLPQQFASHTAGGGVIQDTASSSELCAILAARERATGFAANASGIDAPLVAYTSTEAHSSILKGIRVAGIGADHLRLIDVDDTFAMRPDALEAAIAADRAAGRKPFFVNATVGTTSSHAMDPLQPIGEICRREGIWFHVDAAHAGTAMIVPEHRQLQAGLELADSYCFNPHKWMFTGFDCSAFYVSDRATLIETLSVLPEYLRNRATESGAVIDYRDWHVPLGRRFRALKLWFVIRHYGVEGIRRHAAEHIRLSQELAASIAAHPDFELAAPVPLNLICFRHRGGDQVNQQLMDRLNASGALYLTHTRLNDRLTLRLSIGQTWTEQRHVDRAWSLIQSTAAAVASEDSRADRAP